MSRFQILLKSILPLVGVLLGVGLQYYFSRATEEKKQLESLRTEAYIDFLRSASGCSTYQRLNDPKKESEYDFLMTDAKIRIAI